MIQKCSNWAVLSEFLRNPTKRFHIREISRNIKLAPTSVRLNIDKLIDEKLILEKKDDIFKYYIANFDDERFRHYKRINNLLAIEESGLIKHISNSCSPDAIILFGSYGKGEDIETSDIDLFVQSSEKKLNLKEYERRLKRKTQIFFFESIEKIPKELRNNIVNGIKLEGYLKVWN